ncbi:MAG: ATP-binding cassette domain-containing protein [Myxococcota bacterium]
MSLDAALAVQLGRFGLDVAFRVDDGERVALVGPNGAGKTTVLFALAGLIPLERGRIELGGVLLDDPEAGVFVAPEARDIGVVFQDGRLFPHLSALENVAFGLRSRGVKRAERRSRARDWLERVGLGALADARASTLSGGEARKVALARALAIAPRALLLDEPFASLDEDAVIDMRETLRRHLAELRGPCLLVTHDPADTRMLGARTLRLVDGTDLEEMR